MERIAKLTLYLFLISLCCCVSALIKIKNLKIPEDVEHEKINELILDCDFDYDKDDTHLVLKWFFPNATRQIYQWIPDFKPKALGDFNDILDLNYKASDEEYKMYRAIKIKKVTPELTGNYTCVVSSNESEDRAEKRMVVYKQADKFVLTHFDSSNMYLCEAYGIFPKPVINLYVSGSNLTKIEDGDDNEMNDVESNEDDEDTIDMSSNGLFNVTSSFKYRRNDIKEPTEFVCEVKIPDTNYRIVDKQILYPENGASTRTSNYFLLLLSLCILIHKIY